MVAGACCRRCCSRSTPPDSARCCFAASCSPPPTTSVQRTAFSCAPRHCTRRAAHLPPSAQRPRAWQFTWTGRLAFILLAGNLAWTLAPLGAYVAVCTNVNAAYHAFVLAKHPAFVEGRVSGLSLTSSDGQVVDSAWAARDPASVAAESRASPAQFR